jgi:hypothetical protein
MKTCSRHPLPPPILSVASCWSVLSPLSQPRVLLLQNGQIIISKPHRVSFSCRLTDLRQPHVDISPLDPCRATLHASSSTDVVFCSASDCCDFTAQLLSCLSSTPPADASSPAAVGAASPPRLHVAAHMGDERYAAHVTRHTAHITHHTSHITMSANVCCTDGGLTP